MKLADETLLHVLDIFRRGIIEMVDCSQLLRDLDLEQRADGKLHRKQSLVDTSAK